MARRRSGGGAPITRFSKARLTVALCAAVLVLAIPAETGQWEWEGASRVVTIGDVHGAHARLVALLKGMEVVDADLRWTGGDTHLMFCGDLTDRGPGERAVLDLVRWLESEAEKAGGRVHVVPRKVAGSLSVGGERWPSKGS